jgi:hypothetical protein
MCAPFAHKVEISLKLQTFLGPDLTKKRAGMPDKQENATRLDLRVAQMNYN